VDELRALFEQTAKLAADFYDTLDERPVYPRVSAAELREAFARPLPGGPTDASTVIAELAAAVDPGLVAGAGGRYFGFVIGGAVPASIAADWLTSTWDQNAGLYVAGPSASVVEEVAGAWLIELLGLPSDASFGFVTGGQAATFTALAAARHHVLKNAGWDVERDGLTGAPRIRVVVGEKRHGTIDRALRMLGLGSPTDVIAVDDNGRMLAGELALTGEPTILCAQAGEVSGTVVPRSASRSRTGRRARTTSSEHSRSTPASWPRGKANLRACVRAAPRASARSR
jgi:glutamate/tyrosine decarboxylase-like PLP-dependent enzyme